MKTEKEIRYYFSNDRLGEVAKMLSKVATYTHSRHEVTTMYDNPNPALTFYSQQVDGRLRLRYSKKVASAEFGEATGDTDEPQCLVAWKRRLPHAKADAIGREEEVEYSVAASEFASVKAVFENVLKCPKVSSYERIRNFFAADSVQITCDQFPFGLMVEFELKGEADEKLLFDIVAKAGLRIEDASRLSCDDMYSQLCREQGVDVLPDIIFGDATMPRIR